MARTKNAKALAPPAPRKTSATESALLSAVYADPVSDDPRAVYCDWLLEQNDPRGELMALQLARTTTKATKKTKKPKKPNAKDIARAKELIATHGPSWLGPLTGMLLPTNLTFDRGFVATAEGVEEKIRENPAWSTLVELRKVAPPSSVEMPLLRALRLVEQAAILRLADRSIPLSALTTLSWNGPTGFAYTAAAFDKVGKRQIAAFEKIRCLPSLKKLEILGEHSWPADHWRIGSTNGITPDLVRWIWEAPTSQELDELQFPAALRHLPKLLELLDKTRIKTFVLNSDGEASAKYGTLTTVTRDKKTGALTELEIQHRTDVHNLSKYIAEFDELPANLFTRIRVIVSKHTWKNFNEKRRQNQVLSKQKRLASPITIVQR